MSKVKAIILTVIITLAVVGGALLIIPLNKQDSFPIGKSNYDFHWVARSIKLGLDLEGGMYAIYSADLTPFSSSEDKDKAMEGTMANIETLLFSKGYSEAVVTRQGTDSIRVEIPAISDTEQLIALLGEPAKLEFKADDKVILTGAQHLEDATATIYEGAYAVSLKFNAEGTKIFATETSNRIGQKIAIYVNDQLLIEPTVNTAITDGQAVITGNYTQTKAEELAVKLKAGTFGVDLTAKQTSTISPTLGKNALNYGIIAGFIGLLVIMLFMIIVYRGLGVISAVVLIIYTEVLIFLLAIVPWVQLTLPGIAGIIMSIGMAVDANVIIFERIKDERQSAHRAIPSAVKAGFKKAWSAILDSNVTTIIGGIIMIAFGSTAIQSFGISLILGVVLSLFTAIIVTRLLIKISMAFTGDSEVYYKLRIKEEELQDA